MTLSVFPAFGPSSQKAADAAAPGFGEQHRLVVVGHAHAVGEQKIAHDRPRGARCGIVANDPAVASPFQRVDDPFLEPVANRRLAEIDFAVRGDIEIVGEPHAGIVDDRQRRAIGLRRQLLDVAQLVDAIEAHAGDADEETVILVEGHAERPAADMGEDFVSSVIGSEKADDVALPRAGVDVVVPVENDVFGSVDLAQTNDLGVAEAVVHRIGR